ncbi:ABC transporter substrate-binding protein [Aeromonas hydrophila]|uniref:ABC transporter substrate-binding protein n=1 Tax=Aeromonas hydrophila TaxID=644 RepID=UPI0008072D23|nr:ABC transporter substrate-binding protein [Aeromonas hydrophila]ANS01231.1 hypothetical protein A9258_16890 [Aeromonas hydrophila]
MSRQVFSALGLFLFMLMAGASQAVVPPPGKANTVRLTAPPIPQAVPLLWASESRIFHEMGTQAIFIPWRSPEQLHTFVATGKVDAVITTQSTVSSLVNKGIPCRVLAVYSAPLWVVTNTTPTKHKSTDTPNTSRFAVLDGKRIFLPYGPGNMPELVLKMFSHTTNIYPDIRYSGSTIEAANLLQHEQNTYALLPEPAATLILGKEKQRSTVRLFTLEELWMEHFPGQTAMPTAALIMVGPLAADADLCATVRESFIKGFAWAREHPERAVQLAVSAYPELGKSLGAVSDSVLYIFQSSTVLGEEEGRKASTFVLERLFEVDPASIGGKMPAKNIWGGNDAAP